MNQFACPLSQATLTDVIERVLNSRTITNLDRHLFLAATFCGNLLNSDQETKIKKICELLQRGRLQVVD